MRRRPPCRTSPECRARGFTLLEILVVLLLAGLLLVLLAQGLRVGWRAADLWRGHVRAHSDLEPVEGAVRRMIERMDPGVYPEPPQIRGTAGALAFTTELPDPESGGTMAADVRLEAAGGALVLWWTPHGRGIPFAAPPVPRRMVVLERVARLEFAYGSKADPGAWRTVWTEEALPAVVRLRLVPAADGVAWPPILARPLREAAEE